jgi:hypothetical protein
MSYTPEFLRAMERDHNVRVVTRVKAQAAALRVGGVPGDPDAVKDVVNRVLVMLQHGAVVVVPQDLMENPARAAELAEKMRSIHDELLCDDVSVAYLPNLCASEMEDIHAAVRAALSKLRGPSAEPLTAVVVHICVQCNKRAAAMQVCARCRGINYCSRDCQRAHWPAHRGTCRAPAWCDDSATNRLT